MPYDFASGFNTGGYGSGFAGRQSAGRFSNVYGYNDQNQPLTSQAAYNQYQQSQQQPATGFQPQGGTNPMDFFARMAGMGGGYAQQPAGGNYQQSTQNWNSSHSYNANPNATQGRFSNVPKMNPDTARQITTTGPENVAKNWGDFIGRVRGGAYGQPSGRYGSPFGGFR